MRKFTDGSVIIVLALAVFGACSRPPQAQEARFLKRAETLAAAKDFARASLELRNAARVMPNDPEPYYRLGLIELQSNNPGRALASFRRALELNPNHAGAKLKTAELLAASSSRADVQEAARRLIDLQKDSPDPAEAAESLAFAQWRLGKTDDAARLLSETLEKFPARLHSSVALARIKVAAKDLAGAEEILQSAAKNAPQSSDAALALGRFYVVAAKLPEAEQALNTALHLDAHNGAAWATLAALQLQTGRKQEAEESYRKLSALPGYKPVHALFLFQDGRREEAIAEFKRLADGDPRDREARGRLVAAYLATDQKPQAEAVLNEALQRNPKDVDALIQRGRFYLAQGRNAQAENDIQQALHFRADSVEAHIAMSRIQHVNGKLLLEQRELASVLETNPQLLVARVQLARSYMLWANPAAALAVLEEAPQQQRRAEALIMERNWALFALHRFNELRVGIAEGQAVHASAEWSLQSGALKMAEGGYIAARIAVEDFLKQRPGDPRGVYLLAQTYLAQNQPAQAAARLKDIVAHYPENAQLNQLYGDVLSASGNRAAARQAYAAASKADPHSVQPDVKVAEIDLAEGKREAAQRVIADVLQREPGNIGAHLLFAAIAETESNTAQAIAHYRAVVEIDDKNLLALNNLAYLLAPGDPNSALNYAQKALGVAPDNATVQDTLGWIYCRKGIYPSALHYLKASVDKEPTPRRRFHLAIAYIKSGDSNRGQPLLGQALSEDPSLSKTEQLW